MKLVSDVILRNVMSNHLVSPSCLCLCTPPQLRLCYYIILPPLHLCYPSHSFHLPYSISFISSTIFHLVHFIYYIPSRLFHLPYSISFISSTIFHLVHFIHHSLSRSFHLLYSISFISSTIFHLVHFIYHSPSRSFYWSHIVHYFHICHIWPYSCSIVIQSYFHVRLRNTILFKHIC